MLVIEARRLLGWFERLPVAAQYGVLVIGVAFFADLLISLGGLPSHHAAQPNDAHLAHLSMLIGMLIVLGAVVRNGVRTGRHPRRARVAVGGSLDAPR